jgi:hypothetical protein
VLNQPAPRVGLDEFNLNHPLVKGVERHQAGSATDLLSSAGRLVGSQDFQRWADEATPIRRVWLPTTGTGTGSTRSSTTPRITR